MPDNATKNVLVVRGGWDGHQPIEATDLFIPFLKANGYSVDVEGSPRPYADAGYMRTVDLIVQCNTMATIEPAELEGLRAAIEAGSGMAGWHGGIADSYRNSSDYLHLIGGQFACHPGKHPAQRSGEQSDNYVPYRVNMAPQAAHHPITTGIGDFDLVTEQYWVLWDDYIESCHAASIDGSVRRGIRKVARLDWPGHPCRSDPGSTLTPRGTAARLPHRRDIRRATTSHRTYVCGR